MVHEELGGYCTTGAPTKETFVNDNSKATVPIDSTTQPTPERLRTPPS